MAIRDRLRRLLKPEPQRPTVPEALQRTSPAAEAVSAQPAERPSHELILYKFDSCPFCRRVARVIDDLDLEDIIELRDTRREPQWRSDLIKRTGRAQVPCLFIDGVAMFESADISDWLRSNYA